MFLNDTIHPVCRFSLVLTLIFDDNARFQHTRDFILHSLVNHPARTKRRLPNVRQNFQTTLRVKHVIQKDHHRFPIVPIFN